MSALTRAVLARYPAAVAGLNWVRHESPGFTGAEVWRGEFANQPTFALKAWPPGYPAARLAAVHTLMFDARVRAGLAFVPAVAATIADETVIEFADRIWDVTAWMPGLANYHAAPSPRKLEAACQALARLHRAWAPPKAQFAPCPAVARRLAVLAELPPPTVYSGPHAIILEARTALAKDADAAIAALRPWADRLMPLQPCLCDVWHDHVLFTSNEVTGIIDYGEVKLDHPAVDLARLLGDLVGDDDRSFQHGLAAYRAAVGQVEVDAEFVRLLDRTGLLCAVAHWVKELQTGPGSSEAIHRLERLLCRLR